MRGREKAWRGRGESGRLSGLGEGATVGAPLVGGGGGGGGARSASSAGGAGVQSPHSRRTVCLFIWEAGAR